MNGRKRHILVDTLGLLLAQYIGPADVQDRDGAQTVMDERAMSHLARLQLIWADTAYRGKLATFLLDNYGCRLEIVHRNQAVEPTPAGEPEQATQRGFQLIRWRWIVERTFGWIGRYRRMSKDYEHKTSSSETWLYLSMARLMLGRLAAEA